MTESAPTAPEMAVHFVDVFGNAPYTGNPLPVVTGADGWSTEQMQQLTRWFNLSETAFLLPPTTSEADYRVRIFSLGSELPFAGHPTLGTCHVWSSARDGVGANEVVQECGAGLVRVRRDGATLSFAAPPLQRSGAPNVAELDEACRLLRIDPGDVVDAAWIDNGPGWLGVELSSAEQVLALEPHGSWPSRIDVGVVGAHPSGAECAVEVRAFLSNHVGTIVEDPVTGSLNASIGQWLFEKGSAHLGYTAAQGTRLGRDGRVFVSQDESGQVWVGGRTHTQVTGTLH